METSTERKKNLDSRCLEAALIAHVRSKQLEISLSSATLESPALKKLKLDVANAALGA